jgi:hypothetical protein
MSAFRQLAAAALVSVSLPFTALVPALAQDAGDPPDSVARIAEIAGTVSFHPAGSQEWQAASQNYPVTVGSGVWAEPRSHASVDINGARIHLDGSSDLEITAIDPQASQLSVPQGAIFVHVYPGAAGQSYEIDTPRGAARIAQPGQYEIEAGDDQHPMTLTVYEGVAQMVGQNTNLTLQPGQRGLINPDNSSATAQAQPDDFVRMVQAEEQAYANTQQTAQYVSPAETGYQDLARYGQWQQAPQYGAVWYPQQVAADWAPYRYGHWAYVAPWGWTWVDDAPWGFTPFHYGRWVEVGGRWGWVPGERVARPVYAPALVSFFGNIGGVGIDLSVGWVPLAPEEVYVPPYRHTPRYVHDINIVNVRNETKIVNVVNKVTVVNYNNYANRRAATVVDRQTMADSHAVAAAYRNQPKSQNNDQRWAHAQPVTQLAVKPQANIRPATAPKFDRHQTGNAQFAARTEQGKSNNRNSNGQFAAQPQNNQSKSKNTNGNGQFAAQPQSNQSKPKNWNGNGQFAAQPQQKTQRSKNAAPGPAILPQNGTANAASKQQQGQPKWQGQGKPQDQMSKKSKNAAPGPVILPQSVPSNAPQPQGQNGQAAASAAKAAAAPAAPTWKQNNRSQPNQLPASIQNKAQPQPNSQKHKDTGKSVQQPQMPLPQVNQPAAKQNQKQQKSWQQNGQFQNGGQQHNQSKQSKQQIPQSQGQPQSKQNRQQGQPQPQGKAQSKQQGKPKNQNCNPQGAACTQ